MYIDSHAHLYHEEYRNDLEAVIERARLAGVEAIVVPGTNVATSREAVSLAERFTDVYACVGIHPHEAAQVTDNVLAEIEQLSHHPRVVAIGEIGLDFYYDNSPRETQEDVFRRQIDMAIRRNMPIVVHTRESMMQAINIVQEAVDVHPEWRRAVTDPAIGRGVFHCFTGTPTDARTLFQLGFFVSYPGMVTFKNSPVLETLKTIGFEHILLETDSPYLAPVPFRGKRNEPAYVASVANRVAALFQVLPSEVAAAATKNTRKLFGIR
jgi:TatD DNase family protein